jgi:hypothetical protein
MGSSQSAERALVGLLVFLDCHGAGWDIVDQYRRESKTACVARSGFP